jgi:Kef-type K+ transport system membrane component KefB
MLLLEAGVELDVAQLRETGAKALCIGVTGTILPLVVGIGIGLVMASSSDIGIKSALAVGASFSPTSLGVAASALKQGKMLDTPVGQLIVSSCVVDDILALILLSMFQVLVEVDPPIVSYFIPFISSIAFLMVLGGSAITWLPTFIQDKILKKLPEQYRELTMFSIMTAMLLAYLPLLNYTKSSYLTGAFLAGATFSQIESAHHAFIEKTHQLMTWLLRVFFAASIGFQVPVKLFSDPYVIGWGFILYSCVMAKFPLMFYVPQFEDVKEGASYNPFLRDRLITGLAMTCRGEFSFIIAAFALGQGLISAKIYAAIVWAVLLSCITSPFILLSLTKYFNKQQFEYLKATNPTKQMTGSDGMTPLYLHIKSTAPASWGQQEIFRKILNDMNLEVMDRRTNRNGRTLSAEVQTDLYVKDKGMNVKFQKIAGQKRIKNALKAALDFTMDDLNTLTRAVEELLKLVDGGAPFFMQFDTNNDGVVSLNELKNGLENELSIKLTQSQARKVMDLFDDSKDGLLQEDEMVSLDEFKRRLQAVWDEMKSNALDISTRPSEKPSLVRRMSTADLSLVSLGSLEKEAQAALEELAREQDQIIARGTEIEDSMQNALGGESEVVVDVW